MPELPEVEALAIFLRERAVGRRVARADATSFSVLKTFEPPLSTLAGRVITSVGRHGKFLDLIAADGELHLVFHLARAGWLRWRDDMPDKPVKPGKSPLAFRLVLEDGAGFDLTEQGTQKRLAVYLVGGVADVPGIATLGPEPLADDFDVATLAAILNGRRTQIKGVLRDQHIIAGIGNAYSDEVLHAAKMSPFKLASSFTPDEVAALHAAIVTTLQEAVKRSAGLAAAELKGEKKTGLRVHGKAGQLCPVCGDTIREVSFADSSLQYCATCQTGGKPLADRRMSRLLKLYDSHISQTQSGYLPLRYDARCSTFGVYVIGRGQRGGIRRRPRPPFPGRSDQRRSCLTAMREEPPPHRSDNATDPAGEISADRLVALARWTLTPDNAHRIPLMCRGVFGPKADRRTGSAAKRPAGGCPR